MLISKITTLDYQTLFYFLLGAFRIIGGNDGRISALEYKVDSMGGVDATLCLQSARATLRARYVQDLRDSWSSLEVKEMQMEYISNGADMFSFTIDMTGTGWLQATVQNIPAGTDYELLVLAEKCFENAQIRQ